MKNKQMPFETGRPKTFAFCGGAFGDEGKGRIVDYVVDELSKKNQVVVYRDNGGANAGHTVELPDGQRIAFHQLPSGLFIKNAILVLGKGMVISPGDLVEELQQIREIKIVRSRAKILIDEMAVLSLDTHRAYESVLKKWDSGGSGATGRGISPAYTDILMRHPLRVRDLIIFDEEKIKNHYRLYSALVSGLGEKMANVEVPVLGAKNRKVGTEQHFISRLRKDSLQLKPLVKELTTWIKRKWEDKSVAFVFEKAQAIGLDSRWGVYPDITASDTTFDGIYSSTSGIIDPQTIQIRAGVIKATYMSSVGSRKLPTLMIEKLAHRIREDAHEYGATTKRPRDIAYLDIPALSFFAKVGSLNRLVLTHMDVCYEDVPIKICTGYKMGGKLIGYSPDQEFLKKVKPIYKELPGWDVKQLSQASSYNEFPKQAKNFIDYISKAIGVPVVMITTGPKRNQGLLMEKIF